jgi:hypothetical protein
MYISYAYKLNDISSRLLPIAYLKYGRYPAIDVNPDIGKLLRFVSHWSPVIFIPYVSQ